MRFRKGSNYLRKMMEGLKKRGLMAVKESTSLYVRLPVYGIATETEIKNTDLARPPIQAPPLAHIPSFL